jgi:hypothetical protein
MPSRYFMRRLGSSADEAAAAKELAAVHAQIAESPGPGLARRGCLQCTSAQHGLGNCESCYHLSWATLS